MTDKTPALPVGLFEKIIKRIHREKRLRTVRRLAVFSVALVGSIAVIMPAFQAMRTAFSESGFAAFFSLIFSDSAAMLVHWQSFGLALLESLPAMSIIAFLAVIFVLLESLKFLTRDLKAVFTPQNGF